MFTAQHAPIRGCQHHNRFWIGCNYCGRTRDARRRLETERTNIDKVMADIAEQYDAGLDTWPTS